MPPIPVVIPQEIVRLLETLEKHQLELEEEINRLRTISGPAALQQELAGLVRDGVRRSEGEIEEVRALADDCDREAVRLAVLKALKTYEERFAALQSSSRKAILQSKQNLNAQARLDRELLFAPSAGKERKDKEEYELRQRDLSNTAILKASNSITTSLRRTAALMAQELERSQISTKTLSESSQTLQRTNSEYRSFSGLMRSSRAIITRMEQSDWLDRIMLWTGVLIFTVVVLWILKKRTVDVGVSWAGWVGGGLMKIVRLFVRSRPDFGEVPAGQYGEEEEARLSSESL